MIGLLRTAFRSFALDGIKVNDLEFGDRLDWLVRSQKYDEFRIKTSGHECKDYERLVECDGILELRGCLHVIIGTRSLLSHFHHLFQWLA